MCTFDTPTRPQKNNEHTQNGVSFLLLPFVILSVNLMAITKY